MSNISPFYVEKQKREIFNLRIMQACEFYGMANTKDNVGLWDKTYFELFYQDKSEPTMTEEETINSVLTQLEGE